LAAWETNIIIASCIVVLALIVTTAILFYIYKRKSQELVRTNNTPS